MAKKIIASLVFVVLLVSYAFCESTGFAEYALLTCLSDCYSTYSPVKSTSEFYDCVYRCRREYEAQSDNPWKIPW